MEKLVCCQAERNLWAIRKYGGGGLFDEKNALSKTCNRAFGWCFALRMTRRLDSFFCEPFFGDFDAKTGGIAWDEVAIFDDGCAG